MQFSLESSMKKHRRVPGEPDRTQDQSGRFHDQVLTIGLDMVQKAPSFADKPPEPQFQGAKDPREVQLGAGKNAYGRTDDFLLEVLWHRGPCAVVVSEERSGKNNTTASPGVLAWPKPIVNTSSGKDLAAGSDPVQQASHHSSGELADSKAVADDLEPEGTSGMKVSTASIDQKHSKKNTTTYLDFLTPSSWCPNPSWSVPRGGDSVRINPTDQPSNTPASSNSDASTAPASRKKLHHEITWQSITAAEVPLPRGWPPFDDPTPWPTPPGQAESPFLRRFSFFLDDTRLEREHDVRLLVFLAHDPRSQLVCRFRDPRNALGRTFPLGPSRGHVAITGQEPLPTWSGKAPS